MLSGSLSSLQWSTSPFPFRTTLVHLPCHGHLSLFTHLDSLTSVGDWGSLHWIPISINPFKIALRPLIWHGSLLVSLFSHATLNKKSFTRSLTSFAQTLKEMAKVQRHALHCASVFKISRSIVYVLSPSILNISFILILVCPVGSCFWRDNTCYPCRWYNSPWCS